MKRRVRAVPRAFVAPPHHPGPGPLSDPRLRGTGRDLLYCPGDCTAATPPPRCLPVPDRPRTPAECRPWLVPALLTGRPLSPPARRLSSGGPILAHSGPHRSPGWRRCFGRASRRASRHRCLADRLRLACCRGTQPAAGRCRSGGCERWNVRQGTQTRLGGEAEASLLLAPLKSFRPTRCPHCLSPPDHPFPRARPGWTETPTGRGVLPHPACWDMGRSRWEFAPGAVGSERH